ncbi:MAG: hypothetical protein LBV02_02840 [Bacteroidales bacterium]|nr:hypothetical protein [Bacteroidales bacterium]
MKNWGLYPVTQQYVKRPNGYALLDLYFPQIKFGIEVNENYHGNIIEQDKMRMEDIFASIPEIHLETIKEDTYDTVRKSIDHISNLIKNEVDKYGPFEWKNDWKEQEYTEKLSQARKKGKLHVSDSIGFKRIQITNDIFHMNFTEGYLQRGKSFFKKTNTEYIWIPHLTPQKDWENKITDDWETITEKYKGSKEKPFRENSSEFDKTINRYTFARYRDALGVISYRFIGVFKFSDYDKDTCTRTYKRVNLEFELL